MNAHQRRTARRSAARDCHLAGALRERFRRAYPHLWESWQGALAETVPDTVRPLYDAQRSANLRAWRTMKGRTLLDQIVTARLKQLNTETQNDH